MKKIISIGVALALLCMAVVPVAVAADTPPATYAKIPFTILGSGLNLIGDLVTALQPAGIGIPSWITGVMTPVATWVEGPFSYLTELTAWSMVAVGDVVAKANGIIKTLAPTANLPLGDVATMFYVIANRVFDAWGTLPTPAMNSTLPPALGLNAT